MQRTVFKLAVLAAAVLGRSYLPYAVLGLWNRAFGGWRSVFFCYAGGRAYQGAYALRGIDRLFRWSPNPIGVLSQGRGCGLVLAAPITEADFLDPANAAAFRRLRRRLRRIAWLLGVRQIHLAGILPSVLRDTPDFPVHTDRDVTARIVVAAAAEVVADRFGGRWPPVILLGGAGFVGSAVAARLEADGRDLHVVDPRGGAGDIPPALHGRPALLIDVARHGALGSYISGMWPGLVVLNDTFPEPSGRDLARLDARGVELWHVAGVRGRIVPGLPFGYAGAVPCCAVHDAAADLSPVVIRLTSRPSDAPPGRGGGAGPRLGVQLALSREISECWRPVQPWTACVAPDLPQVTAARVR